MLKEGEEWLTEFGRGNLIQRGAHLAVTGDDVNTINPTETFRLVATSLVKSQQRLILERKYRETAHQDVDQGDFAVVGSMVCNLGKILANGGEHGVGVEMFAHGYLGFGGTRLARASIE
jgi:hypothetical protein